VTTLGHQSRADAATGPLPPSRRLAKLLPPEAAAHLGEQSILVLPLGAIRSRGPQLPLDTDLRIVSRCGEELLRRAGQRLDLFLLEPLPYGPLEEVDGVTTGFGLKPETLLQVIDDIGAAVANSPARTLVLLSSVTGQDSVLEVACRQLHLHHRIDAYLIDPLQRLSDETAGATTDATPDPVVVASIMRFLAPESVEASPSTPASSDEDPTIDDNLYARFGAALAFGWPAADGAAEDFLGRADEATAERGARLFDQAVDNLIRSLDHLRRHSPSDSGETPGASS
jgi:creatinine amidohydrolase